MTLSLGEKIKNLREAAGISFEDFVERASISNDQLIAIESGALKPSMGLLTKIVRVLGVRLGTILDGMEQTAPILSRADDTTRAISFSNNDPSSREHLDFFSLADGKGDRNMEPFVIDVNYEDNEDTSAMSTHEGEEFIYVIDGNIKLIYGKDTYELGVGDTIYYDSIVPHKITCEKDSSAKVLGVLYSPV